MWFPFERGNNFNGIVVAIPLSVSAFQLEITLIASIAKNRIITDTIERVQELILQRFESSHNIYELVERRHTVATMGIVKLSIGMTAMMFLLSAMVPISYAIVGSPSPQQWILPFEAQ